MSTETLREEPPGKPRTATPTPAEIGLPEEPLTAKPADPPATHVRARLDALARTLLAHEAGTRSGVDPEDLHQMRVAVRRMRSVLKLSGGLLGPAAEPVRAELGWLGAALGEVRDYDVLIGHLRATVADFEAVDQLAAQRLVATFVAERGKVKRKLTRALNSTRYATLRTSVAQLARPAVREATEAPPAAVAARSDLVGALRKAYRKLHKAVAALGQDPVDDDLHDLRILGKRLRYAAELAKPAARKKQAKDVKALIGAAKHLQEVLGDHQDAVVAAERMRALVETASDAKIGFIAGRIAERELAKRARARAAWPAAVTGIDQAAQHLL
ncbi:CHAD domain-containing protein [Amycolatopsis anabasis]|uniref:CHAD domain-containing protein n=1 Tax=Amycolatopsis anabasis TaxID=1840409 RepID=UPI001FEBFEDE|nr:CHAD domain-containing protein [Amycolatopsis anabasis]